MNLDCQGQKPDKFLVARYHGPFGNYWVVLKRIKGKGKFRQGEKIKEGQDYFLGVHQEAGMSISKYSLTDLKLIDDSAEYPLDRACKLMLQSGKTLGINQGATKLLEEGLAYAKRLRNTARSQTCKKQG